MVMTIVMAMAAPAQGALTATHSNGVGGGAGTVTVTGDGDDDLLDVSVANGELIHGSLGGGFNSDSDWDSALAGDQKLPNTSGSALVVNSGGGADDLELSLPTDFVVNVTYDAGGQADFLGVGPDGTGVNRVIKIGAGTIAGFAPGSIATANLANTEIFTGDGKNRISVLATPGAHTDVVGGTGDDTLDLAGGTTLNGGKFTGAGGTDTIDYSAFTTPVSVNLATSAHYFAQLSGSQQVPPVTTSAFGFGDLTFTDLSTNTFTYTLRVTGLTTGQISDSHIHSGSPTENGPVIFPIGPGGTWSGPGARTTATGQTDPDITEPALRGGNTYFNVHTTDHSGGEIRGRIRIDGSDGYSGTATGMAKVENVENVIGGSAPDSLTGSVVANRLVGNGGADELFGGEGADTLVADDGVADVVIDCGAGEDPAALVDGLDPAPVSCP
jgi:hypothetical protein